MVRRNLHVGIFALCLLSFGCAPAIGTRNQPGEPALIGGGRDEVSKLQNDVARLRQEGRDRDALPVTEKLLALTENAAERDPLGVAKTLIVVAPVYEACGQTSRAEDLYLRALAYRERVLGPEHPDVATVRVDVARLYRAHGKDALAEEFYRRALATRERAFGDSAETSEVLNDLGRLHHDRREYQRAEDLYERALAIQEKTRVKNDTGSTASLSNLAALYLERGDYARAESLYQRALSAAEQAHGREHPRVAAALTNLALVEQKLGKYVTAEQLDRRALAISEHTRGPDHRDVATVLNNLASLLDSRGEYAEAERLYERALAINEKTLGPDHLEVATVLNNLASLQQSMGRYEKAEEAYRRSLTIRENALGPEHREVAASLNNLGQLAEARGDYEQAESLYRRALAIYRTASGDRHPDTEAVTGNLASLLMRRGNLAAAYPLLKQGDWPVGLGSYYLAQHDYSNALKQFSKAAHGADANGDTRHLVPSHLGLGLALEGLAQPSLAAESYRVAVRMIEEQRAAIDAAERMHFLGGFTGAGFKRIAAYEGLVRTSAALGKPDDALQWAEYTKARELLEATAHRRTPLGLPAEVAQKEDALVSRLGALYRQRDETSSKNPEVFADLQRVQIPGAKGELDAFVAEIGQRYPAYAAYKYPQPLGVSDIALGPTETLLEFAVTADRTFAWLLRGGTLIKFTAIPVRRDVLDREIQAYRSLFENIHRTDDLRSDVAQGKKLYELILKDLISACVPGDPLVIVPDGSLGLIPFEALVVDGNAGNVRYLGDVFPVVYAQSATVFTNMRSPAEREKNRKQGKVLVLADPVFDAADSRWPSGTASSTPTKKPHWDRLDKTATLVHSLQEAYGTGQVMALTGMEASEAVLRKQGLDGYAYLIMATHGVLGGGSAHVREPALVLSQAAANRMDPDDDGYLTLSEVAALKLDADVAALIACETGVGANVEGEGVMGMGWAFAYAGARNTVMSLWSVYEGSAVQLTEILVARLREGMQPQEALRQARIELRSRGYRHPYFWAPFILVGVG